MGICQQLQAGDHIAFFYRSKAEQFACVLPYIATGLQRHERCLYIADDNSVPMILRRLKETGIDVDDAHDRGALKVVTKRETYLRHGVFEPEKMIDDLRGAVSDAQAAGFTALRASGEMTWALDLPSAVARLLEYEVSLEEEFQSHFLAMCQYDETRFPANVISEMIHLHPTVIARGRLIKHRQDRADWYKREEVSVDELISDLSSTDSPRGVTSAAAHRH